MQRAANLLGRAQGQSTMSRQQAAASWTSACPGTQPAAADLLTTAAQTQLPGLRTRPCSQPPWCVPAPWPSPVCRSHALAMHHLPCIVKKVAASYAVHIQQGNTCMVKKAGWLIAIGLSWVYATLDMYSLRRLPKSRHRLLVIKGSLPLTLRCHVPCAAHAGGLNQPCWSKTSPGGCCSIESRAISSNTWAIHILLVSGKEKALMG